MGGESLNINIIDQQRNIIEEVIDLLGDRGIDYSSKIVVFPGRRPSYFLRKRLSERIGQPYIPPRIFSMDDFIDFLYEERLGISFRKIEAIECVSVIYKVLKEKKIDGLGIKKGLSLDHLFPLGIRLYNLFEELIIEMVPSVSLRSISNVLEDYLGSILFVNQGITTSLYLLMRTYEEELKKLNLSTRSLRYKTVAESLHQIGDLRPIIFAGFFALTEAEKRIIKETLKDKENILLVQEGPYIYEKMKEIDENIKEIPYTIKIPERLFIYQSPDSHSQIFACNRILAENTFDLDERTCFLVPDPETLLPLGYFLLSSLEADYNISLGYPLIRTPIFGFLSSLMQMLISMDGSSFFIPDYLNFILHPYTKNVRWKDTSEATRIILHNLEQRLNSTYMDMKEIEDLLSDEDKERLIYIHEKTIAPFLKISDIKDFFSKIIDLLRFIIEETTAKNHPLFIPFVFKISEILQKIINMDLSSLSFEEVGSYFNLLKHIIKAGNITMPGTPLKGIQVLGFLETRNLSFERLFILDAIEGVLPPTEDDDSLLPYNIRVEIGLPTYRDKEKIGEYYFFTLLSKAKEAYIFYIESEKDLRSRFLEKIIWEKQKETKSLDEKDFVRRISSKFIFSEKALKPIEKTEEVIYYLRDIEYSPTSIERYFRCPLSFYYCDVLRLDQKRGIDEDIQRDQIGEIVHEGLKILFEPYIKKRLYIPHDYRERIDRIIKKLAEDRFGKPLRGMHYLLYHQIKKHLSDFIEFERNRSEKNPIVIEGIEIKKNSIWNGFRLKGRIDRIDRIGDNYLIIDYKTGSSRNKKIRFDNINLEDRKSWGKAIPSLQLPLYIILFLENKEIDLSRLNACYLDLSLSNFNEENKVLNYLFEEENERSHLEKLFSVILNILMEIKDPNIPFSANKDDSNCGYCKFRGLCGVN